LQNVIESLMKIKTAALGLGHASLDTSRGCSFSTAWPT
jgi:hypothetical protein